MSTALVGFDENELAQLLRQSQQRNEQAGITGVLVYEGERFLQAIEGPPAAVQQLFARIETDPRHAHIEMLAAGEVPHREFANWSMSFTTLTPVQFQGLLGYLTPNQLPNKPADAAFQLVLREFLEASAHYPAV